jgi:AraC family transcriptional regulator, activator of mtrCDE
MDILSDILQTMKLRGTAYFRASFHSPWGMDIAAGQFANFHVVLDGSCWLRNHADGRLHELTAGDIAMFPHGSPHALSCTPECETVPATTLLESTQREASDGTVFGGDGRATTTLVCGHFEYDRKLSHPLFETLDDLITVSPDTDSRPGWAITAAELASQISAGSTPGAAAIADRLAEALFIQALTGYIAERDDSESFLGALFDRQISQALSLMHEDIAYNWTLERLAQTVAMSRSQFAQRFRLLVGETPMLYLARWRMLRAHELLVATQRPLVDVAEAVGYRSEFAFSKAFKKIVGRPPGAVRRRLAARS